MSLKWQLTKDFTENKSETRKIFFFPALSASCRQETATLQAYYDSLLDVNSRSTRIKFNFTCPKESN